MQEADGDRKPESWAARGPPLQVGIVCRKACRSEYVAAAAHVQHRKTFLAPRQGQLCHASTTRLPECSDFTTGRLFVVSEAQLSDGSFDQQCRK